MVKGTFSLVLWEHLFTGLITGVRRIKVKRIAGKIKIDNVDFIPHNYYNMTCTYVWGNKAALICLIQIKQ